jgi:hypothetical protein
VLVLRKARWFGRRRDRNPRLRLLSARELRRVCLTEAARVVPAEIHAFWVQIEMGLARLVAVQSALEGGTHGSGGGCSSVGDCSSRGKGRERGDDGSSCLREKGNLFAVLQLIVSAETQADITRREISPHEEPPT